MDWDIRLRSIQASLAAAAVRKLLNSSTLARRYPYGHPELWDILYLGHCSDYWYDRSGGFRDGYVEPENLTAMPHVRFTDTSIPQSSALHPSTKRLLRELDIPEFTRLAHPSIFPSCTFGYAVSRFSAWRLLEMSGAAYGENPEAYDVFVKKGCRRLRCFSVTPELFHHRPVSSLLGALDGSLLPPVDTAAVEQAQERHETANIDCGFWSGEFAFDAEDARRLGWLQKQVGRRGRCLKKGREWH